MSKADKARKILVHKMALRAYNVKELDWATVRHIDAYVKSISDEKVIKQIKKSGYIWDKNGKCWRLEDDPPTLPKHRQETIFGIVTNYD